MPFGVRSMVAKRSSLVMALLLALPQAALALGLGNIHLKSHLDQPLDARIDLLDATPGALQSLSVGLASHATFTKYGLNWPSYLDGARVEVTHGAGGRIELHLTSQLPVTDPILTLLVKASWDRGVLFREYTVLLNPPVYVPSASQPHPVAIAAPVVGNAPRTGTLPGASAPAVSPPATAPATLPHSVSVRPGDTLSGIASRYSGGGMDARRTRQWMVAIYQRNPQAFAHNMNLLRAGTVLRIPAASAVAQVSSASAWQEVNRQDSAWRASQGAGGSGRLRLVAPQSPGAAAGTGAGTSTQLGALQAKVRSLQSQLAQEKRLVQVKSAALAALQARLAAGTAAPAPAVAASSAGRPAAPARAPVSFRPAATRAAAHPAAPSALAQTLRRYWWVLTLLALLVVVYVLARVLRARRESAADELLTESADARFAQQSAPAPIEPMSAPSRREGTIDVREATHEQPRLVMNESASPVLAPHVAADQTMSSETALNLEQGDPLAEADFHMAYGLYDQAADLIRIAIQREPERRDLKLKLLEVFFVWGNKDQFIEMAHELAESRDRAPAGEWDKIVIMGRQLAPDDPLFAGSEVSDAASHDVDLDLEGGQGRVDFDLMGGAAGHGAAGSASSSTGSFDLDIGAALGEEPAAGGTDLNATVPDLEKTGSETGVTQEMEHPFEAAPAFEPMEPTVEQPALYLGAQAALREKVEALSQGSERTAELAIDDLGLDLGAFETTVQPSLAGDSPTLVAGLDEQSREVLAAAEEADAGKSQAAPTTGTTSAWQIDERELENLLAEEQAAGSHDTSETSRLSALESAGGVDFDLGGGAPSVKPQGGNGLDFDIGTATLAHADLATTQDSPTAEHEIADLEPVTMSEVGTKLDLARAYMDMGDPEGARSILEEVMHEGSDAQRQEAGRLLESLPG
jgi:pilus assembly protein FimV